MTTTEPEPEVPASTSPSPGKALGSLVASSPVDGAPLDDVAPTPLPEVPAVVARARAAQATWAALPIAERVRRVFEVRGRLVDRAAAIAAALRRELGKPEAEALIAEVIPSVDLVTYWCEAAPELLETTEIPLDPLAFAGKRATLAKAPRGVVALVTPWNFPVAIPLRTIVPALLAGNAVVFKPSEVAPRAGKIVADLFEGLLPEGLLGLVQGGADAGHAVCAADVDLVVFTGGTAAGKRVAFACAERLIPCSLELGGKDAAIVLADADLDRAAHGIVWGAMNNAGQSCASIERAYVVKEVAAAFVAKATAAAKELRAGIDVGPLATAAQRAVVAAHVNEAKDAGAEVLVGGDVEIDAGDAHAFPPTLLTTTRDDLAIVRDETFGPVLPIVTVDDADDAIARANASRYGLTASVWTRDLARGEAIARRLRAGVVTLNNHAVTAAIAAAPWSGVGDSGAGVTGSPLALGALTRPRVVFVDGGSGREPWWYPYTPLLRKLALAVIAWRGARGPWRRLGAFFVVLATLPRRVLGDRAPR